LPFKCYVKQNTSESLEEVSGKVQQAARCTDETKVRALVVDASGFQVWEGS